MIRRIRMLSRRLLYWLKSLPALSSLSIRCFFWSRAPSNRPKCRSYNESDYFLSTIICYISLFCLSVRLTFYCRLLFKFSIASLLVSFYVETLNFRLEIKSWVFRILLLSMFNLSLRLNTMFDMLFSMTMQTCCTISLTMPAVIFYCESLVSLRLFLMITGWDLYSTSYLWALASFSCRSFSPFLTVYIYRACILRWLTMYVLRSAIWNSSDLMCVLSDLISSWYY
jgi:hypothetical protein